MRGRQSRGSKEQVSATAGLTPAPAAPIPTPNAPPLQEGCRTSDAPPPPRHPRRSHKKMVLPESDPADGASLLFPLSAIGGLAVGIVVDLIDGRHQLVPTIANLLIAALCQVGPSGCGSSLPKTGRGGLGFGSVLVAGVVAVIVGGIGWGLAADRIEHATRMGHRLAGQRAHLANVTWVGFALIPGGLAVLVLDGFPDTDPMGATGVSLALMLVVVILAAVTDLLSSVGRTGATAGSSPGPPG